MRTSLVLLAFTLLVTGCASSTEETGSDQGAQSATTEAIRFAPGASSAIAPFDVANGAKSFQLGARAGQVMSLDLRSNEFTGFIVVRAPSGNILSTGAPSSWTRVLPENGTYLISLLNDDGTRLSGTLGVAIKAPTAISFAAGTFSKTMPKATVSAKTEAAYYTLAASQGQTLALSVTSSTPGTRAVARVFFADGELLDTEGAVPTLQSELTTSGQTVIEVTSESGAATTFELTATVVN